MRDHVCPWWIAWTFDNPLRRVVHPARRILRPFVNEGDTVADVGAGLGYFTIALAELVGSSGRVLAVDLQSEMLRRAQRRSERQNLDGRIHFHQCTRDELGIQEPVDFALAFWMAHEVADQARFFAEIAARMKPAAHFLMVEPILHVSAAEFEESLSIANTAGLRVQGKPGVALSNSVVFRKER